MFADYNRAIWPGQLVLYALGVGLVLLAYRGRAGASRWVALGLAALWAWAGAVYHLGFFRTINPTAVAFGAAFLAQAMLLVAWGLRARAPAFGRVQGTPGWLGGVLLGYALFGYPLLGWALGHRYPASPTFGVPCPTTIATLGLLVWVRPSPPWWVFPVPLAWAGVGTTAALSLGMREDLGLLGAGAATAAWLWHRRVHSPLEETMQTKRHFSAAEALAIGTRLGIDWMEIDLEQLRRGLEVELEHGAHDPQTNVTNDDPYATARIAWAHLREIPDYYTRLDAMEADAVRANG